MENDFGIGENIKPFYNAQPIQKSHKQFFFLYSSIELAELYNNICIEKFQVLLIKSNF